MRPDGELAQTTCVYINVYYMPCAPAVRRAEIAHVIVFSEAIDTRSANVFALHGASFKLKWYGFKVV